MSKFLNEKLSKLDVNELKMMYRKVFSSEEGQLVLQDLKNRSFFDTSTTEIQGIWYTDRIFFHEGIRSSILHIVTMIETVDETNEGDLEDELA
jgi:hypothetical protein